MRASRNEVFLDHDGSHVTLVDVAGRLAGTCFGGAGVAIRAARGAKREHPGNWRRDGCTSGRGRLKLGDSPE